MPEREGVTPRFADAARKLAGATGRALGWPPHWFWAATPAELSAILAPEEGPASAGMDRQTLEKLMEGDSDGR